MRKISKLMTKTEVLNYLSTCSGETLFEVYPHTDEFVNLSEVSKLGVSRQRLHNWVKLGKVRTEPRGKQYKYSKSDIERLL